jgi:hypothetical protein
MPADGPELLSLPQIAATAWQSRLARRPADPGTFTTSDDLVKGCESATDCYA